MKGWISMMICAAAMAGQAARGADTARPDIHPMFANTPELRLQATPELSTVSMIAPTFFGWSTGRPGHSFYVCGIKQIHEIRMDTGEVVRHAVPFDFDSRVIYMSGVRIAWLGQDGRIYIGMQGGPGRVARLDPPTAKLELLGSLEGCGWQGGAVRRIFPAPGNKCYVITYNAYLSEIDMTTGKLRTVGRLADDAIYVNGDAWIGEDGWFYCTAGQRPEHKVRMELATGKREFLDELPKGGRAPIPKADFPDCAALYDVKVEAEGDRATVTFGPKGKPERRTVQFTCSTIGRDLHTVGLGPDGKVYCTGSYKHLIFDPAGAKTTQPVFQYNIYDYLAIGKKLYLCGYPNARIGAYDTARPLSIPKERNSLWEMRAPQHNPYEVVNLYDVVSPEGEVLKMKRAWSLVRGADGMIYIGSSASRQNRGGSIVIMDPATDKVVESLRAPFKLLGVSELCTIDGGKQLGVVTWVSPDPDYPGKEPDAGKLFLYDVATRKVVHVSVPMPDCQVLKSVIQAPGTRMLVGLGLRGVKPTFDMDDAFFGDGELFFFDLDQQKTVKRIPFDFPLSRREGRALAVAPDGSIWASGGGGILRIDATKLTATPLARCGESGNMAFIGKTLYMVGTPSLRYGDVSGLVK